MMIATLKKCTKAIEDVCQIKYDFYMLHILPWTEEIRTAGKIYKPLMCGSLTCIDF